MQVIGNGIDVNHFCSRESGAIMFSSVRGEVALAMVELDEW